MALTASTDTRESPKAGRGGAFPGGCRKANGTGKAAIRDGGGYSAARDSGVATSSSERRSAAKPSFHSVAAAISISAAPSM